MRTEIEGSLSVNQVGMAPAEIRKARKRAGRARVDTSDDDRIDLEKLKKNLIAAMEEKDLTAFRVAKLAKVGNTFIPDILRDKNRNPRMAKLRRVADVLGRNVLDLAGVSDRITELPFRPIPIVGIAEAGAFRPMPDIRPEREDELPSIIAGRSPAFPRARHFAYEVRGDSMNAAKPTPIVAGAVALCVDMIDAELTIETGRIYLVRRTLDRGQTYEHTIKRAHVFRDRIELRPESTNPRHQAIIIPRQPHRDHDATEITAIGLVYGVFSSTDG